MIVAQYDKDQDDIEALLNAVKTPVEAVITAEETYQSDSSASNMTALKATFAPATKAIEQFNKDYAALNAYAKADFDKNVADKVGDYATINANIAKAETIIAKYTLSDEDVLQAIAVGGKLAALHDPATYPEADIKKPGSAVRTAVEAKVKELDKDFENAKIKEYCRTNYEADYEYYLDVKEWLKESATASDAVKNTMAAIDGLRLIDADKEVLTQAEVDAVIANYNSVGKMYDALSATEKSFVTNYAKYNAVREGIIAELVDVFEAKVKHIYPWLALSC